MAYKSQPTKNKSAQVLMVQMTKVKKEEKKENLWSAEFLSWETKLQRKFWRLKRKKR